MCFQIREIAIDPWNSTQLALQLQGDGFEVVTFGQGFRDMTSPTGRLLEIIKSGRLVHNDHPVLRWNASNMLVMQDPAGNLKPNKEKRAGKIDLLVALIMALGRSMVAEPEEEEITIREINW